MFKPFMLQITIENAGRLVYVFEVGHVRQIKPLTHFSSKYSSIRIILLFQQPIGLEAANLNNKHTCLLQLLMPYSTQSPNVYLSVYLMGNWLFSLIKEVEKCALKISCQQSASLGFIDLQSEKFHTEKTIKRLFKV